MAFAIITSGYAQTSFKTFYTENNQHADFSFGLNTSIIGSFLSDDDKELKELVKKAKHARIVVFSDNIDAINSNFNKFIRRSSFDKLMKIKDESSNINLYTLEEKDIIKEIVIQISTDNELVLLGLNTNLTHADLAKIFNDNHISLN